MPYISPLQIIQRSGLNIQAGLDKDSLRLARQALLAEIELSASHSIKLGNTQYGKDDILKLFDKLQSDGSLAHHQAIHDDPSLLHFLADHRLEKNFQLKENPHYQTPEFCQFNAPFFAEAYAAIFKQCLQKPDFDKVKALRAFPLAWWTALARRQADQAIFESIRERIRLISTLVETSKKSRLLSGIRLDRDLYHPNVVDALNLLPDQFVAIRHEYGMQLVHLAYAAWNKKQKMEGDYIINRVDQLNGSQELKRQISYYWEQSSQLQAAQNTQGEGLGSCLIYVVIFVLIFVMRLGCDSRRSKTYELPTYRYTPPSVEQLRTYPRLNDQPNREDIEKFLQQYRQYKPVQLDSNARALQKTLEQLQKLQEENTRRLQHKEKFVPPKIEKVTEEAIAPVEIIEEKKQKENN